MDLERNELTKGQETSSDATSDAILFDKRETKQTDLLQLLLCDQPEINEDPQNIVSQEAGQHELKNTSRVPNEGGSSPSISAAATGGKSQLEQKTFTRPEIHHPTTMENLPGDLLLNIFIRLLAKQLAQMRCVSKSWNALLSQSSFVKSHLHHSMHNKDQILLVFYDNASQSSFVPKPFTAHPCRSPRLDLTNFIKLPPVYPKSRGIRVIGAVHGLICSYYSDDVIHIWNPARSSVSTLPPHHIPSHGSYEILFRFGFDPKAEDYKVVKLIGLTGPSERQSSTLANVVKEWLQVEVYSMRKGSWEFITQRFPSHVTNILEHEEAVCIDGHDSHIHWLGCIDAVLNRETIVAFDLGLETFLEIPFPDSVVGDKRSNELGVLGGKLCVMSWQEDYDYVCEVWVMVEYGVVESWVKHHVLPSSLGGVPYGSTSHNEFLLVDDDLHIVLYDPTAHKFRTLEKPLEKPHCGEYSAMKVVEYVDSLVWVDDDHHIV